MKQSHDDDCKLVFVDHGWVRDPSDTTDTIYVPPADWIINQEGTREMYIPPAGWVPDHVDSDENPSGEALEDDLPDVHDPSSPTSADYATLADYGAATESTPSAPPPPPVQLDVDLRCTNHRDFIYNQGRYGSCVTNAISSAFVFTLRKSIARKKATEHKRKEKIPFHTPS